MANFCVKPTGTGSGNGSDWTNAMDYGALTPARGTGNTYYLAGGLGTYGSKTLSTAVSGSTVITIKKATVADHITDTGWSASMGTSQAVFSDGWDISSSFWTIDGVTGGGPGQWETNLGFSIIPAVSGGQNFGYIRLPSGNPTDVTVQHVDIKGRGILYAGGQTDLIYVDTGSTQRLTLRYLFMHDSDTTGMLSHPCTITTLLMEYCKWARCGGPTQHREIWSLSLCHNVTMRYNLFEDFFGTGAICAVNGAGISNSWDVYRNLFYGTGTVSGGGIVNTGVFSTGPLGTWPTVNGARFYHNVVANMPAGSFTAAFKMPGSTSVVSRNNIWRSNHITDNDVGTSTGDIDYEYFSDNQASGSNIDASNASHAHDIANAANPFISATPWLGVDNWALLVDSLGVALGAPYNTDMFGNVGNSRGAIQFSSGDTMPPAAPTGLTLV